MIQPLIPSIHRDGWRFIGIFALCALLFATFSATLGWLGALLTGWCIYFFRDPERVTPVRENLVISPADGLVCSILEGCTPPDDLDLKGKDWTRISIFLSIFDAHINRIPIQGMILKNVYHAGKFFNASLDKASDLNERQSLVIQTKHQQKIGCVQIAGLIARRIVCDVSEGQEVKTGERYGLIRFGSRVDIYLPSSVGLLVLEGQRMIAGETILADFESKQKKRAGDIR